MEPDPLVKAVKKRGRPKVDEHGASVSTWLRPSEHDRLIEIAKTQRRSVSAVVRSILILRLK